MTEQVRSRTGSPAARLAGIALLWLAAANLISYAVRNALAPSYGDLNSVLGLDYEQFGLLATVFMAAHAAATVLMGWLGDRYDRRRVIGVSLLLASVAGIAGTFAPGFASLALSRAAVGFGTAAVVPVGNSLLGELFEGPRKASAMSIFNLGLFLGGVSGVGTGQVLGFPTSLLVIAIVGAVVAVGVLVLRVPGRRLDATPMTVADLKRAGRAMLRLPSFRWIMGSTTAMAFASGAYLAWFLEFLRRGKGMSAAGANVLFVICIVGGLAGVLTGGRLADAFRRRRVAGRLWAIALGMGCTVPAATACILLPTGAPLYMFAVATMFFVSWYHAPMAASVDDLAPPGGAASAQALVIFLMHLVGTAPASWVVGRLIPSIGFEAAMLVPTGMVLVAALLMTGATRSFERDYNQARLARAKG